MDIISLEKSTFIKIAYIDRTPMMTVNSNNLAKEFTIGHFLAFVEALIAPHTVDQFSPVLNIAVWIDCSFFLHL
jgi:hypothetical protein